MDETSPAVKLRGQVVLLVVVAIIVLTFLLYGIVGLLLAYGRAVPGEMWLAAGNFGGLLGGLLLNSKHERTAADPAPVQVVNQADQPVPVDPAPADPLPEADEPADEPEPPAEARRRR